MRYVPNGVCTQRFAPNESLRAELRQELALSEKTILIGMAARFHPVKNHRLFLKAAAIFSKRYPEVEFLLCGGQINSENRELMHLVDQSRLSEKVHLLGVRKDMPATIDLERNCAQRPARHPPFGKELAHSLSRDGAGASEHSG